MFGRVNSIDKNIPPIKCICPKCNCEHKVQMNWIGGNVKPRVYCNPCRAAIGRLPSSTDEYAIPKGSSTNDGSNGSGEN